MFNRYSFPIHDQTTLVFLDPVNDIMDEDGDEILGSLNNLYGINRLAAVVFIEDGTNIGEDLDWNDLTCDLLQMTEEHRKDHDSCKQISFIRTNCPPHALDFNCSKVNILDNMNLYFMQNSAYQLFRAGSATNSVETDFCKAMETMKQIIKKIVDGIYQQA